MPPERGPARSLLTAAWLVLLACALLWAAAWLVQQIWIWLLVIALVAAAAWLTIRFVRWRRDRWLR